MFHPSRNIKPHVDAVALGTRDAQTFAVPIKGAQRYVAKSANSPLLPLARRAGPLPTHRRILGEQTVEADLTPRGGLRAC